MKLAVISDLHMGRGDRADTFGHDDAGFVRFLQRLEQNFEKIVLLGDAFEIQTAPRLGAYRQELGAIERAHPEIVRRLLTPRYLYVHGNHDHPAARLLGAVREQVIAQHGLRLLFTHGHDCDWVIRRAPTFSDLCVWMGGWLRRHGWDRIYRWSYNLDVAMRQGPETPEVSKFQRWAVALAESRGADLVVTGHTHRPGVREFGSRLFLNSGTCSEGRFDFLHLDTASATFGFARGP